MNKERPYQKAKFAVVDLADNLLAFELINPIGYIEDKHGILTVHLTGVAAQRIENKAQENEEVKLEAAPNGAEGDG